MALTPRPPWEGKRIVLGVVLVVFAVTSWGQADPRWWWSDRPVAPPGADRRWPHLTTTGGVTIGSTGNTGSITVVGPTDMTASGIDAAATLTLVSQGGVSVNDELRSPSSIDLVSSFSSVGFGNGAVVQSIGGSVEIQATGIVTLFDPELDKSIALRSNIFLVKGCLKIIFGEGVNSYRWLRNSLCLNRWISRRSGFKI